MKINREVRVYMVQNAEDHLDRKTMEVNETTLAEDAWTHFHPNDQSGRDIPEEWFELAIKVAADYEQATQYKPK